MYRPNDEQRITLRRVSLTSVQPTQESRNVFFVSVLSWMSVEKSLHGVNITSRFVKADQNELLPQFLRAIRC